MSKQETLPDSPGVSELVKNIEEALDGLITHGPMECRADEDCDHCYILSMVSDLARLANRETTPKISTPTMDELIEILKTVKSNLTYQKSKSKHDFDEWYGVDDAITKILVQTSAQPPDLAVNVPQCSDPRWMKVNTKRLREVATRILNACHGVEPYVDMNDADTLKEIAHMLEIDSRETTPEAGLRPAKGGEVLEPIEIFRYAKDEAEAMKFPAQSEVYTFADGARWLYNRILDGSLVFNLTAGRKNDE